MLYPQKHSFWKTAVSNFLQVSQFTERNVIIVIIIIIIIIQYVPFYKCTYTISLLISGSKIKIWRNSFESHPAKASQINKIKIQYKLIFWFLIILYAFLDFWIKNQNLKEKLWEPPSQSQPARANPSFVPQILMFDPKFGFPYWKLAKSKF